SRIKAVEPIALLYNSTPMGYQLKAICSNRTDFHRSFPHLNPVKKEHPVSFCVARAGMTAIYDRLGIIAVLDKLENWFLDAKSGDLSRGGWEPVPVSENSYYGLSKLAALQEHAWN